MQDENVWPYVVYLKFMKKKLLEKSVEYRVVNDGFIFIIIRFIEGDYTKRKLVEEDVRITEINAYDI